MGDGDVTPRKITGVLICLLIKLFNIKIGLVGIFVSNGGEGRQKTFFFFLSA